MSLSTPSQPFHTPVLSLHRDVFLFIIKLNANMFSDPEALHNTRVASQVCRDWRCIILEAPSLWARLIDLDNLIDFRDHWRDTVLQRIGNTPLWIRATHQITQANIHDRQKIQTFFFSILDKHWHRIEKLVVYMDVRKLDPQLWRAIYLPAPRLQVFDIDFVPEIQDVTSSTSSSNHFFSGDAPFLHTLHVAGTKFDLQAPWVTNIRSIHIGHPHTLSEMLEAFKMMPYLENIRVEHVKHTKSNEDHHSSVKLPNLGQERLHCDFQSSVAFLDSIIPARGCFLDLYTSGKWDEGPFRPLSKFGLDYFTARVPTALCLDVLRYGFSFVDKTNNPAPFHSFSATIRFDYLDAHMPATGPIIAGFTFPAPVFNFVTQLEIKSLNCPPSDTKFHSFFLSLPSVVTLIANEQVVGDFLAMQEEISLVLLPLLKVVKLDMLNITYFRGASGYLFQFLRARRKLVHPISILDLTEVNPDVAPALTFLEELVGMEVRWKRWGVEDIFKYECGTGNPEKLPFRSGQKI